MTGASLKALVSQSMKAVMERRIMIKLRSLSLVSCCTAKKKSVS